MARRTSSAPVVAPADHPPRRFEGRRFRFSKSRQAAARRERLAARPDGRAHPSFYQRSGPSQHNLSSCFATPGPAGASAGFTRGCSPRRRCVRTPAAGFARRAVATETTIVGTTKASSPRASMEDVPGSYRSTTLRRKHMCKPPIGCRACLAATAPGIANRPRTVLPTLTAAAVEYASVARTGNQIRRNCRNTDPFLMASPRAAALLSGSWAAKRPAFRPSCGR